MTKNDFREELLNGGFSRVCVVSINDNNGRDLCLCIDWQPTGNGKYTKIEWEGDLTDVLRDRRKVFNHVSINAEGERVEMSITLEELMLTCW